MKTCYIVFWAALWLFTMPAVAQDRPAYWVHGLNDNNSNINNVWVHYNALFAAERRLGPTTNGRYATSQGVTGFANAVANANAANSQALAIGHSMGGLAVREVSRQNPNQFGGMILCGAPLRGAKIMNSIANGSADAAIESGVSKVSRGPLATLGGIYYSIGGGWGPSINVVTGLRLGIDYSLNQSVPIDGNAQFGATTVDQMQEGSNYMNDINSFSGTTIPRVMIWGNENSPIHFRLASSSTRKGNNNDWSSNDDQQYVSLANTLTDVYNSVFIANTGLAVANIVLLNWGTAAYFTFCAIEWKVGADYISDQSEPDWATLIGAEAQNLHTSYTYMTNVCTMEFYYGTCHSAPDPQACYNSCWQPVTVNYSYAVQSGSDGLVAGYSQRGDWSTWSVGGGEQYEAQGVNHLEMRGHDNMTARFRDVFSRGDIFSTPTR